MTTEATGDPSPAEPPPGDPAVADPAPRDPETASGRVPASVQTAASWSWRLLLIAAAVGVLLYLVAVFKVIVVPVAVGLLLTVLLTPPTAWLVRRLRLPRAAAAAVSVLATIVIVVTLVTVAGRSIVHGLGDVQEQAAAGFDKLLDWLADSPLHIGDEQVEAWLDGLGASLEANLSPILSGALSVTTTVGQVLAGAVIALFCTFFFLLDGRRIWTWVVGLLPRHSRDRVHQAGRRGLVTLAAYARTQILVALVDGVGIGVGAAILGVPLSLPLGILVFVGSFVPFVGAIVTGSIAVLVALVTQGWVSALIMLGIVLLVQQIEGNVLQPFLMGYAVSLHPVAVLLVVTAGTLVAGIVGALFAVPIAAVLNTVILYLHGYDRFPQLGLDDRLLHRRPASADAVPAGDA